MPKLGVGLHLVLVDGRPALSPDEIPDLVGCDGNFSTDILGAGIRIFCSPRARRQVLAEIRAQLEAFRRTGLALDHVNAHHHFHLHPVVQRALIRLAPEFGVKAVRVPLEPRRLAAQAGSRRRFGIGWIEAHRAVTLRRRLDAAGIAHNDWIFGLADSGTMIGARMQRYLEVLPEGTSELYVHPATQRPAAYPKHYLSRGEFEALVDPAVAGAIARGGIETISFAGLSGAA
jgi:hopanoid biosynthesis associated protein HpnK